MSERSTYSFWNDASMLSVVRNALFLLLLVLLLAALELFLRLVRNILPGSAGAIEVLSAFDGYLLAALFGLYSVYVALVVVLRLIRAIRWELGGGRYSNDSRRETPIQTAPPARRSRETAPADNITEASGEQDDLSSQVPTTASKYLAFVYNLALVAATLIAGTLLPYVVQSSAVVFLGTTLMAIGVAYVAMAAAFSAIRKSGRQRKRL